MAPEELIDALFEDGRAEDQPEEIPALYRRMDPALLNHFTLSLKSCGVSGEALDDLAERVCNLCKSYERNGFHNGVRFGAALARIAEE